MEGYTAKVVEVSKNVTTKEKIMLKDTSNAVSLDEATSNVDKLVLSPEYYAIVQVHNERSEDKDYKKYVVVDRSGTKYVTGSESFFTSLREIMSEMQEEAPGEEYSIEVFRKESKNYKGKTFITCALI